MSGLAKLRTPGQATTGRGVVPTIWRGEILETYGDGTVAALVPGLLGDQAVRMPCTVAEPLPGDRVIVGAVEGRAGDLVVIGAYELVRAGYVDAAVASRAPFVHRHPWSDLDNVPATFPPSAHTHDWATGITGKPATFAPSAHRHPMTDLDGALLPAQLPTVTTTEQGAMTAADKVKLNAATNSATGSTLVMRHSSGSIGVTTGTAATDAANKAYVDARGLNRAAGTVAVPVLAAGATTTVTVTFPASRFTVAPIVNFDTGDGHVTVGSKTVTTTGATITLCNYTTAASVAATGQWQAVQMTATTAAG